MTRHYVTACREQQVPVLYASMVRHCRPFTLHVLAWDFNSIGMQVSSDADVRFTPRWKFLGRHPDLLPLPGPPRNANETVCSVRWTFALDVMQATGQPVTVVDGDVWFWSSPEPLFEEIGAASVALSPHGFAPAADGLRGTTEESHLRFGRFNGGWSYWADQEPLRRMAEYARQWCYIGFQTLPDGRVSFGDQGRIEDIEREFGAHVIRHVGVNAAPWNINRRTVVPLPGGRVLVDGRELVSYHYQSLRLHPDGNVAQLADASYGLSPEHAEVLYPPYLAALRAGREG